MTKKFSLKDELFNPTKVEYLAGLIKRVYPEFSNAKFTSDICQEFPHLELKERIFCIRKHLEVHLPNDFESAISIILKSLPPELDSTKTDDDFGDFILAPLSYFVVNNGRNDKHLELSLFALSELTKRFTVEDAIRFFINTHPKQSFEFMQRMSVSDNYHQRRLASEGLRPKLPWCVGLDFDYKQSIEILDVLYYDATRYVVRSVANHLNDITKIDSRLVIQTLKKWQQENNTKNKQNTKEFNFLLKHSLRTLVKQGNSQALELLGFKKNPNIEVSNFDITNTTLNLGDYLMFNFDITARANEQLIIDYIVTYPTKTSKKSTKVFKIKQIKMHTNECLRVEKKHLFKLMSTKKLYSGKYHIELQINGDIFAGGSFQLTA